MRAASALLLISTLLIRAVMHAVNGRSHVAICHVRVSGPDPSIHWFGLLWDSAKETD